MKKIRLDVSSESSALRVNLEYHIELYGRNKYRSKSLILVKKNNIFNFEILNEIFWVPQIFLESDGHVISVQGNKKYLFLALGTKSMCGLILILC